MARVYSQVKQLSIGVASGHTVVLKRVYYTDLDPGVEKLVGDGGADDPGGAATVSMSYVGASGVSGLYYWEGTITVSGNYTMFIDGSRNDNYENVYIATGKEAEDVALNNAHRISDKEVHGLPTDSYVVGTIGAQTIEDKEILKPQGIVKGDIGLDNVENKSASTILAEQTKSNIESLGFKSGNQAWVYYEDLFGATTFKVQETDILASFDDPANLDVVLNASPTFYVDDGTDPVKWNYADKTNLSIYEKDSNGVSVLDYLEITGLSATRKYRLMLVVTLVNTSIA